jgi:hypothetical protein
VKSRFAIYEENSLSVRSCPVEELPQSAIVIAAHLDGKVTLDTLIRLITVPLLYATIDTVIDFAGAQAWFEAEQTAPAGIAQLISRLGSARALELLLTEATVDAQQAPGLDLLNGVCSLSEFDERIERISLLSISAIELAVELARRAPRLAGAQAEALERYVFALRFAHPDQQEGMQAFLEKRQPRF